MKVLFIFLLPLALTGQNQKWSIQPIAVMLPKFVKSQNQNKMSEFKLSGRIYKIGEVQKVTDSFSVQKFRIETDDQYPQKIEFQAVNDRCIILEPYKIGDLVTVHFDVRGRDWSKGDREGNATNLNAWKIERVGGDQSGAANTMTAPQAPPAPQAAPAPIDDSAQALFGDDDPNGDLPF
jgi:hypothetical protein